jgi:hypothetical protein
MYAHPLGLHDWDWSVMFSQEIEPGLSFIEQQSYFFNNTMGRFSSTAVTSTLQYWFSPTNFKIFLALFFLFFLWSFYFFISSLFLNLLSRKQIMSLVGALICLYCTQLTSAYEAFYNISCIGTYNLAGSVMLIFSGLLIRRFRQKSSMGRDIALIILGIFIVGSNEMVLIALNWLLLIIIIGKRYYHLIWDKSLLLIFAIILSFSLIAVTAPGNYVRMGYEKGSQDIFEAIFFCFGLSIFNWLRWLSTTPLLLCVLFYIPLGLKIKSSKIVRKFFNYPLFAGFGILTLQPACLFILFYSAGIMTFPERIMDLIFLLTLAGGIYFLQASLVQLEQNKSYFSLPSFIKLIAGLFIILQLFFTGLIIDKSPAAKLETNKIKLIQTNSNSTNAWLTLVSGQAGVYNREMTQVYEEIKQCQDSVCIVSTPQVFPAFVYDKIYDRKAKKGGFYIGEYFHRGKEVRVIYDANTTKK